MRPAARERSAGKSATTRKGSAAKAATGEGSAGKTTASVAPAPVATALRQRGRRSKEYQRCSKSEGRYRRSAHQATNLRIHVSLHDYCPCSTQLEDHLQLLYSRQVRNRRWRARMAENHQMGGSEPSRLT